MYTYNYAICYGIGTCKNNRFNGQHFFHFPIYGHSLSSRYVIKLLRKYIRKKGKALFDQALASRIPCRPLQKMETEIENTIRSLDINVDVWRTV